MRKSFIAFGIASLLGLAVPCSAQFRSDSCSCPPPVIEYGLGYHDPRFYDMEQSLSPDGKMLSYLVDQGDGGAYILDLQTLESKQILVNGELPGEEDISWEGVTWCPYDSDLIALNVASFIDTSNEGVSTVFVGNIFIYRISTGESKIITPAWLQPYGSASISEWLPSSKSEFDTMIIGYGIADNFGRVDSTFWGRYCQQTQALIPGPPQPGIHGIPSIIAASDNGKHTISIVNDTTPGSEVRWFYLDSSQIHAPRIIQSLNAASFSPNSKLVALTVNPVGISPDTDTVFQQVWIFSADSAAPSSVKVINFQCLYCTYNFLGAYAVFLTDSTLAVSMHKDGSDTSALYEITLDGGIVRQLTYVAQSGVVSTNLPENSLSLISYPDPFSQSTQITFTSPESGAAEVTIVNILGQAVARLFSGELAAGEHSFEWDSKDAAAGMYDCVVHINGRMEHAVLVVER